MFERRLKILLAFLSVIVIVLTVRAAQIQLFEREYWKQQAVNMLKQKKLLDTTRGRILDLRGRVLAEDQPCMDAAVDYRAIPVEPDAKWVKDQAVKRLRAQLGDPYDAPGTTRAQRKAMLDDQMARLRADLDAMWDKLAEVSGQSRDEIDEIRAGIVAKVEREQRYAWVQNFAEFESTQSKSKPAEKEPSIWEKYFHLKSPSEPDSEMDKFQIDVKDEFEPHVILPAIDTETQNELGKDLDRYPGLKFVPGTHRYYPYHEAAAHVIGNLGRVSRNDIARQKVSDELADYLDNDLIGKSGAELLCEPALRGTRGRVDLISDQNDPISTIEPVPGKDVRLSVDIELQRRIQDAFAHAVIRDNHGKVEESDAILHGAAVVIDVPTGQVRALVSFPTYDANEFDDHYQQLVSDSLNHPLVDRATMSQVEPGSTVKPMVGLAAITSGRQKVTDTIECTGYLVLDGVRYGVGRCWVASRFFNELNGHVAHHPVPVPHPTGFLTFSDALERSCNVFFETTADRIGIDLLSAWYSKFGLGRVTGLGILESHGKIPTNYPLPAWRRRAAGWFSGIGEGFINATPIQMANVAATIARRGVWMRPTLLVPDAEGQIPITTNGAIPSGPREVDLHLDPAAIDAAVEGMHRVVYSDAGTGTALVVGDNVLKSADLCGKTGTAQTSPLAVPVVDEQGKPLLDENGKVRMQLVTPSTPEHPNQLAPWYRGSGKNGTDISHAWYIGFAPRSHPQIAFAVLVEYGGSGGVAAASVAREALHACIDLHYLRVPGAPEVPASEPIVQADNAR